MGAAVCPYLPLGPSLAVVQGLLRARGAVMEAGGTEGPEVPPARFAVLCAGLQCPGAHGPWEERGEERSSLAAASSPGERSRGQFEGAI